MFERTSPGTSEWSVFSSTPDLEERSTRRTSKSKTNDTHDLYEKWVKGTGQVGTDADRSASRAMDKAIGTRTLPTNPPPPVIVYINPQPGSKSGADPS